MPKPSLSAQLTAAVHELQEAQAKNLALRQELYGWQEHADELEDELDFLWNRQHKE